MGKVNTAAKQYMKKNENIADLCNFYIYGGRQVVHPEDLSELDTVSIEMIYDEALKKLPIEISYLPTIKAKMKTTTKVRLTSVKHTPVTQFFF